MNALEFLTQTTQEGASDLFIVAGRPLACKKGGKITLLNDERIMPAQSEALIREIYELADHRDISRFLDSGDDDFSFAVRGLSRYRVSAYMQRGSMAAVIRVITFDLPDPGALGIPRQIIELGSLNKGLVLVTGPAGSGKSTTCSNVGAAMAQAGKKVLLVDGDMQLNLSLSFFSEEEVLKMAAGGKNLYHAIGKQRDLSDYIVHTPYENLDLIPSSTQMSSIEYELFTKWQREFILKKCLQKIKDSGVYDYILIDAPPTLGGWVMNCLLYTSDAADEL